MFYVLTLFLSLLSSRPVAITPAQQDAVNVIGSTMFEIANNNDTVNTINSGDYGLTVYACVLCGCLIILISLCWLWLLSRLATIGAFGLWRSIYSYVLYAFSLPVPKYDSTHIRRVFNNTPGVLSKGNYVGHSHPTAARVRNNSSSFMSLFALVLGYVPYYLQMSPSDVRNGRVGCRTYHWAKDLASPPQVFSPGVNDMTCIVDTDMYLDMPWLLANNPLPYVISTFTPSAVARVESDYNYTFDNDNNVVYQVSGGAKYVHPVWNYQSDILTAKYFDWFTLCYRYVVYNIDRRQLDADHQVILITPMSSFRCPLFDIGKSLGHNYLSRLKVVTNVNGSRFSRLRIVDGKGTFVSTGRPLSFASAKIPIEDDDTIAASARVANHPLTNAGIKMMLSKSETDYAVVDHQVAIVLNEYHSEKVKS